MKLTCIHQKLVLVLQQVEQTRIYKELGYDGIIVTDHFYNGNTAISRNMPWEKWVNNFTRGYENAKKKETRLLICFLVGKNHFKVMTFSIRS